MKSQIMQTASGCIFLSTALALAVELLKGVRFFAVDPLGSLGLAVLIAMGLGMGLFMFSGSEGWEPTWVVCMALFLAPILSSGSIWAGMLAFAVVGAIVLLATPLPDPQIQTRRHPSTSSRRRFTNHAELVYQLQRRTDNEIQTSR